MEYRIISGAYGSSPERGASAALSSQLSGQIEKTFDHGRHALLLHILIDHFIVIVRKFGVQKYETVLATPDELGSDVMQGLYRSIRRHFPIIEMGRDTNDRTA